MRNRLLALGVLLSGISSLFGDYLADREAAAKLAADGKQEEALAAFLKLTEGEISDFQKADALEQAARGAARLERDDRALELAQQIPLEPVSKAVRIYLLANQRRWQAVVDQFRAEDLDAWPDAVAGEAALLRGQAHYYLKEGAAAETDLKRALGDLAEAYPRGVAWLTLGDNYRDHLQDSAQALQAYTQAIDETGNSNGWITLTAVRSAAGLLRKQGKHDDALQVLARIDLEQLTHTYWRITLRCATGEILGAQGKAAEAVARFREALEVPGISAAQQASCEKQIRALQSPAP